MQARDKWVHFVMSQEELERMQQKMDELGIRNKSSYLRKMALDGYCVNLEPSLSMRRTFRICRTGRMKSGILRKRFWQDWRRSSKETVWQIAVTPDT